MPFADKVSVGRLTTDEILNKADSRIVAENIVAEIGYPPQIFRSALWPFLAARLRNQWHGYFKTASSSDKFLLILSAADSCEKLANNLSKDVPRSTWSNYFDQNYGSYNNDIKSDLEWPVYETLAGYVFAIGKQGDAKYVDLIKNRLFHYRFKYEEEKGIPIMSIIAGMQELW